MMELNLEITLYIIGFLVSITVIMVIYAFLNIHKLFDDLLKKNDRLITILSEWQKKKV